MALNINLLSHYWRQQRQQWYRKTIGISVIFFILAALASFYARHYFFTQQQLHQQVASLQQQLTQLAAAPPLEVPIPPTIPAPVEPQGVVSLHQAHADIREILQTIAASGQMNLLLHESVQGTLTVNFNQLPWEQALKVLLELAQLVVEQQENVLLVRSAKDETERLKTELQQQQQSVELIPLEAMLIPIQYAKAQKLASLLQTSEQEWLSPRGSISVDERTNTLVIRDIPENLQQMQNMIKRLDVPVRQVAIEARIMNVQETFSKELGILWEVAGGVSMGNDAAIATISNEVLVNLELLALENNSLVEELAHPRLVTADQQTAVIRQGEEIPYQQSAEYGASTVSFKPAVLELQVTPHVTPDDHILLKLLVKNDSRGLQPLAGNVPVITTKEIRTQVLVRNGQTVALGGIYTQGKNLQEDRVPVLGYIPGIGKLFTSKATQDERKQLLVFVTPKIIVE